MVDTLQGLQGQNAKVNSSWNASLGVLSIKGNDAADTLSFTSKTCGYFHAAFHLFFSEWHHERCQPRKLFGLSTCHIPSRKRLRTFFMIWLWSNNRNRLLFKSHWLERANPQVTHHCEANLVVIRDDPDYLLPTFLNLSWYSSLLFN